MDILIYALLITVLSEELVLLIMNVKDSRLYLSLLIINIITNLSMNIILQYVSNYYLWLYILEVCVFIIEGLVYLLITNDIKKAIIISLICNVCSYLIGLI